MSGPRRQGFADAALTFIVGFVAGPPARLDAVFDGVRPSRGADRPRPEHALGGVSAITAAVVAPASVRELPKVLVAGISVDELRALDLPRIFTVLHLEPGHGALYPRVPSGNLGQLPGTAMLRLPGVASGSLR